MKNREVVKGRMMFFRLLPFGLLFLFSCQMMANDGVLYVDINSSREGEAVK